MESTEVEPKPAHASPLEITSDSMNKTEKVSITRSGDALLVMSTRAPTRSVTVQYDLLRGTPLQPGPSDQPHR